jgi:hypothetical protein
LNSDEDEPVVTTDLAPRKNTLPQHVKGGGTIKIAFESSYASVGEDKEILGRTYLRIREVGTFTQDTPYNLVRERINETLKAEQLRDLKALEIIERGVERRAQIQR